MADLYFEDFKIGDRFVSAGVTLSESMILDFALRYDPQPFHLDVEAAKESHYGGLIARGFQTIALGFRAFLDLRGFRACGVGSPRLDELRWARPVRARDNLHNQPTIAPIPPSRSKTHPGT